MSLPAKNSKRKNPQGTRPSAKLASDERNVNRLAVTSPAAIKTLLEKLARLYPDATTSLHHDRPLELLIATILSAQCTDERVNQVTPTLFSKYPDARALALAPREAIEAIIYSTGFFRAKAKSIQGTCQQILERHQGEVPKTMEALTQLPGVARKTANVVLGSAFGIAAGIVVDTHVKRLSGRLGLTHQADPEKIEQDLMALIPRKRWIWFGHALVQHGRALCMARKPLCMRCPLADRCPSAELSID